MLHTQIVKTVLSVFKPALKPIDVFRAEDDASGATR